MTLPLIIAPNDPGHIDDHQEIHTLLGRLDGQSTFLAAGSTTGALGSRPAASASNLGSFYFAASVPSLAFSDGAIWREQVMASASNTFTAINNFNSDVFFGSGSPWVDVRNALYGAVGDGVANDTAPITNAFAALPTTGGILYFPEGIYLTTGLTFREKPVVLKGAGGSAQANSSAPYVRCTSKLTSTSNAAVVHFDDATYASIEGQHSGIEDLGIEGSRTAGTGQHGVRVNNRGAFMRNVEIGAMGGIGLYLTDSVAGFFERVRCHHGNLQGFILDPSAGSSGLAAVTINTFIACVSHNNDNQGLVIQGASHGNVFEGFTNEANGVASGDDGITFALAGGGIPRYNKLRGVWDELNGRYCVRFDAGTLDNVVEFVRTSSLPPNHASGGDRNLVHFSDLTAVGNAQRLTHQFGVIRTMGITSADQDHVALRTSADDAEGRMRARSVALTFGLTVAAGDVFPTTVPAFTDALCLPNTRGLTWRNAASSGNIQVLALDGSDVIRFGQTTAPVSIDGALRLTNQTVTTTANAGGASALPATPEGYITVPVNGTNRKIPYYVV